MSPKKSLGQHFLVRGSVIQRILRALDLRPEDRILEIGPGRGALTLPLAGLSGRLLLVEKDRELAAWLRETLAEKKVEVVAGDFLEWPWEDLQRRLGSNLKIVSNLPYNVGTAILVKLLRSVSPGTLMVLMFQREVGERILAKPGTKNYGSLSIFCQLAAEVSRISVVPPAAFRPPPKVESIVLRLVKREQPLLPEAEWPAFEEFLRTGFAQRRKMLRQNLRPAWDGISAEAIEAQLTEVQANPKARAEELSLEQWVRLFKARSTRPDR